MGMEPDEHDHTSLFRFEYFESEDNATYVNWLWLKEKEELSSHPATYKHIKIRAATEEEQELYEEAYADGYGIAALLEFESRNDGVTFRVELDKAGELSQGRKMFQCSVCDKHKDFDDEVGAVNGFYLTELRGESLWHICYDCATIAVVMEGLDIGTTEEGEADS
jgi:hypothetical protein